MEIKTWDLKTLKEKFWYWISGRPGVVLAGLEIPHLKEAFEAYNKKGVEFLSVSIDKDGAAWRKAMKEENMPWAQVQAPKAGKDVMKLYQFSGIPYILVLDQEGRIVGKNLRGQKLMDKLEEMVNGGAKKSVAMPAMGM
ncbi:MAG: TlpA disulfide reductase family protein [Odoribacter splanchnicus]